MAVPEAHQVEKEPEDRAFPGQVRSPGPQISVVSDADGDGFVSLGAAAAKVVSGLMLRRAGIVGARLREE